MYNNLKKSAVILIVPLFIFLFIKSVNACTLTSASWDQTSAGENELVDATITATNCDGQEINVTIWEDDSFIDEVFGNGDDKVNINPQILTLNHGIVKFTWSAEYQEDSSGDPEYYFKVYELNNPSNEIISSNQLSVSQSIGIQGALSPLVGPSYTNASSVSLYRDGLIVTNPEIGILPIDQQFSEKGPAIVKNEIKLPSTETLRTTDERLFEEILIKAGIEYTKQDLVDYALSPEIPVLVSYDSPVAYYPQKRKDFELRQTASKPSLKAAIASLTVVKDLSVVPENAQTISSIKTIAKQKGATFRLTFKSVAAVSLKAKKENLKNVALAIKSAPKVKGLRLDSKLRMQLNNSVPVILGMNRTTWNSNPLYGYNGSGIKIAIIDTGINKSHPDLDDLDDNPITSDPKVIAEADFTGGATGPADLVGHGTHVASTAAGTGQASNYKFVGVAPQAYILNGKVLDDSGSGFESWIVSGIEWAVTNNANVISMSLGGFGSSPIMEEGVRQAVLQGVPVVVAAGNHGPRYFTINTPGITEEAITVGASSQLLSGQSDNVNAVADFSSRGPARPKYNLKPDVVAPGVNICAARAKNSLFDIYLPQNCGNPEYIALSGTSMATPHVAGAVALMLQANPSWTPNQIKSALMGNSVQLYRSSPLIDYYLVNIFEQGAGRLILKNSIHSNSFTEPNSINLGIINPAQSSFSTAFNLSFNKSGNIGYVLKDFAIKIADKNSYNSYPIEINEQGCISSPATIPVSGNIASLPTDFFAGHLNLTIYSDCSFTQKLANVTIPISFGKFYNLTINVTWPNVTWVPGDPGYEFHYFAAQFIDKDGNWMSESANYIFDENSQISLLVNNESFDINFLLFTIYAKSGGLGGAQYKYKHASFVRNVSIPPSGSITVSVDERDAKKITFIKPNIIAQGNYTNYSVYAFLSRPCKFAGSAPNARCGLQTATEARERISFDYEFALDPTDVSPEYHFEGAWGGIKDFDFGAIIPVVGQPFVLPATDFAFLPFIIYYPFNSLDIEIPASELAEIKFELDNPFKDFTKVGMAMAVYSEFLPLLGVGIWNETFPKTKKYIIRNSTCENCHYWIVGFGRTDFITTFKLARVERWDDGPLNFDLTKRPVNNPPLKSHYALFKPPFKASVLASCTSWYWIACFQNERGLFGEFLGLQENSLPFYYINLIRDYSGYLNVTWPDTDATQKSNVANYEDIWALSCLFPSTFSWPPELKNITCNTGNYFVEWKTQDIFKTQTPCAFATAYYNGSGFNVTYLASGEVNQAGQCIPLGQTIIILNSPQDNFNTVINTIVFNATIFDANSIINVSPNSIINVSLWHSYPKWHLNETNSSGIMGNYLFTKQLPNGSNIWAISACDNSSQCSFSTNRTLTITEKYVPWWDSNYLYRKRIIIINSMGSTLNAENPVNILFNHTNLVSQGKSLINGDDLRIVYWNSVSNTELDRFDDYIFNNVNTSLWFKLQNNIAPLGFDDNYWMYYGYSSAISPPRNGSNIFWFFDDFNSLDLSKWTNNGTIVSGGLANLSGSPKWLISNLNITGSQVFESKVLHTSNSFSANPNWMLGFQCNVTYQNCTNDPVIRFTRDSLGLRAEYFGGAGIYSGYAQTFIANKSYTYEIKWIPQTRIEWFVNKSRTDSTTGWVAPSAITNSSLAIKFHNVGFLHTMSIDWVFLANYTSPEPSFTIDIEEFYNPPPLWSNNKTSVNSYSNYIKNNTYQFNITWTDNVAVDKVFIEHDFEGLLRNYSVLNNGNEYYYNISDLAAGNYQYRWYANDTSGNLNLTPIFNYQINKSNNPSISLVFNPSSPVIYGTSINASCSSSNPETSATSLFRNSVDVTPENNLFVLLGANSYSYECRTPNTQNFTSSVFVSGYTINKASNSVNLYLNSLLNQNININYPQQLNATGTSSARVMSLYRNGISINNENGLNITLIPGTYSYKINSTGNQNYTENSTGLTFTVTINKGVSIINLLLNGQDNDITASPQDTVNISAYLLNGLGTIKLFIDDILVANAISPIQYLNTYSLGIYNITTIYEGNENYTRVFETHFLTISNNLFNITLNQTVNLISIPIIVDNNTISAIFGSNEVDIYSYDNNTWKVYHSNISLPSNLNIIEPLRSYFVIVKTNFNISINGTLNYANGTKPSLTLNQGWNLIGVNSLNNVKIDSLITNNSLSVFDFNGSNYIELNKSLDYFIPGKGYWVNMQDTFTI